MKEDKRIELAQLFQHTMEGAFEHGKAMQRLLDAQVEEQMEREHVAHHIGEINAILNKPTKNEVN